MDSDYTDLPAGLPAPEDDGAADHLTGMNVPSIALASTSDDQIDLSEREGRTVVYCYPMTGAPDNPPPDGWDLIPGARGCTPQSCAFRDHYQELQDLGADVYGLSTQTTRYQQEAVERLHLPFPLLSDADLAFAEALRLPTFDLGLLSPSVGPPQLLKRLTMIVRDGSIENVLYPVFPPDRNAQVVIDWFQAHHA